MIHGGVNPPIHATFSKTFRLIVAIASAVAGARPEGVGRLKFRVSPACPARAHTERMRPQVLKPLSGAIHGA